ncbi:AlbA family DNA-binding domain-containing protein [Candidatus Nitrospira bockiana]
MNKDAILITISKALSAFANTEGGHLVLGVADDGSVDGVPERVGSTSSREWLEQQIPNLVDAPLREFRVHTVEKTASSLIPPGRQVIVIDVEDSPELHQARDGRYYYRAGGRSEIARHSYLERRRQRLLPILDFRLAEVRPIDAYTYEGGVFLETEFVFDIENTGQIAANQWGLQITTAVGAEGREADYFFDRAAYPVKKGKSRGIRLSNTILPARHLTEVFDVGFRLRTPVVLHGEIKDLISPMKIDCHLALEIGSGLAKQFEIGNIARVADLVDYVLGKLSSRSD